MNEQSRNMRDAAQLVTFRLGEEMFGIDIFKIREVIHLQKISAIPNAPKFAKGVIKVRDQVIPVVDLKKRLGIKVTEKDKERIVILDLDGQMLGVIVDDISKVLKLESKRYEALPDTVVKEGGKACITHLAKTDDGLIIIISPEHILNRREKKVLRDFEDASKEELVNA